MLLIQNINYIDSYNLLRNIITSFPHYILIITYLFEQIIVIIKYKFT